MAQQWTEHLTADGQAIDAQTNQLVEENLLVHTQLADALDRVAELEASQEPTPEPEPEPEPSRGMWVGSSLYNINGETNQEGYDRRTKEWGAAPEIVRYFFPGLPNGWPQYGTAPTVVSFKPPNFDMKGFGAGKYDTYMVAWLNSLPRDRKTRRVALWHEREDDIEKGMFTKADALAADARLKKLILAANERNGTLVRIGMVLMGWTVQEGSHRDIESYFGDFEYEWIGWDAYPGNTFDVDPDLSDTKYLYGECAKFAKEHGAKNWYICETATSNKGHELDVYDTLQAKWITGAVNVARDAGFKGWIYWDSITGTGQKNNYQIQGPKARAAMGAAIKAA
jgi:hypothetical protein